MVLCFSQGTYCFFDVLVAVTVVVAKSQYQGVLATTTATVSKKSTPGKFAYSRHFQRIRLPVNATKLEKMLIPFQSDVVAAVAVVDAKTL